MTFKLSYDLPSKHPPNKKPAPQISPQCRFRDMVAFDVIPQEPVQVPGRIVLRLPTGTSPIPAENETCV